MARVPQFAVPFRVEDGDVVEVEQDSVEEIEACVEAVLHTFIGSRIDEPDFGIPDETFTQLGPNPSVEPYLAAVAAAEPRAHLIGEARIEDMVMRIVIQKDRANG